jgi:hypothetical protein
MNNKLISASVLISVFLIAVSLVYRAGLEEKPVSVSSPEDFVLPIKLEDLERKLVETGVIDPEKFQGRARTDLNILWAFGLANKNPILEEGPMTDPRYGGPQYFASTGGWTLSKGSAMEHYSKHSFVILTPEQQELVESVSKNIYRPCCNNSTYFPDCNHGMAMLGLLQIMASEGASEKEMYRAALEANSRWFPDTYAAIGEYLKLESRSLEDTDPREILGPNFSSASGYRMILSKITPPENLGGASCGV